MCLLALSLGHSESCDCDKCVDATPQSLPDALEEVACQSRLLAECLCGLQAALHQLQSVSCLLIDLKALAKLAEERDRETRQYQLLTPEGLISSLSPTKAFCYHIISVIPVPNRIWKNSRFQLELRVTDQEGAPVTESLVFQLLVYRCVLPASQVTVGMRSRAFLLGQRLQNSCEGVVRFSKLRFTEVTSSYPEKSVRLVVICKDLQKVQPFVSMPVKVISRF